MTTDNALVYIMSLKFSPTLLTAYVEYAYQTLDKLCKRCHIKENQPLNFLLILMWQKSRWYIKHIKAQTCFSPPLSQSDADATRLDPDMNVMSYTLSALQLSILHGKSISWAVIVLEKENKRAVIDWRLSNHSQVCSNITGWFGEALQDARRILGSRV